MTINRSCKICQTLLTDQDSADPKVLFCSKECFQASFASRRQEKRAVSQGALSLVAPQKTIEEINREMDDELHQGYRVGDLRDAFAKVVSPTNWKNPIDSDCAAAALPILRVAIPFFTGSVPTFTKSEPDGPFGPVQFRVTAIGYYLAVGS